MVGPSKPYFIFNHTKRKKDRMASVLLSSSDPSSVKEAIVHLDTLLLQSFVIVFLLMTLGGVKTQYGRYTTTKLGPCVPGIVDWYLHSTSLVAAAMCIVMDKFQPFANPKPALLLGMFIIHYIQRSILFSCRMDPRKAKPSKYWGCEYYKV